MIDTYFFKSYIRNKYVFYHFNDIDYNRYLFDKYNEDTMREILSPHMDNNGISAHHD
jgi:hypothetical protein